jgi:hypothetical protein
LQGFFRMLQVLHDLGTKDQIERRVTERQIINGSLLDGCCRGYPAGNLK